MRSRPLVALASHHDRKDFDCGVEALNRYLSEQASQDVERRTASVFVLPDDEDRVLGYYTLSATSIDLGALPSSSQKKLPRYPLVPATLLGRLAVSRACQGEKVGERLLMDALFRSLEASRAVASYAMVVDVLDVEPDPMPFYLRYGFVAFNSAPRKVYLPMATIAKLES